VDETGMDGDESYSYGWSFKGNRCFASKPGKSTERISIIAGLCQQKLRGACWFKCYCNADVFNAWLEQSLIPELMPGQTIILDNARFHQSARTRELVEAAHCRLLFLPPYSPQDNLIEHAWFPLKNAARKIMQTFADLTTAIEIAILARD
jgi:transposase